MSLDAPKELLKFEQIWHPEYQRYCEHVFNHLLRLPLELLASKHGRNYQSSQSLSARAQVLEKKGHDYLTRGFDSLIRNAISHGSTYYSDSTIRYVDAKGNTRDVYPWDFEKLFDQLVDCCHAHVSALMTFVLRNWKAVSSFGIEKLPLGVREALLRGVMQSPIFEIGSILDSDGTSSSPMLSVQCRLATRNRSIQMLQGIRLATELFRIGGSNYKTAAVSIDCGPAVSNLLMIDFQKLGTALTDDSQDIGEIFKGTLLWHDTGGVRLRLFLWKTLMALVWQSFRSEVVQNWRKAGLGVWRSRYTIRDVEDRTVGAHRRIYTYIVMNKNEPVSLRAVRNILFNASKRLRRRWVPNRHLHGPGWIWARPSYVWLRLIEHDARVRQLHTSFGTEPKTIAEAEWMTFRQRGKPIIVKQPDDIYRRLRIRYLKKLW
jgi:hypothetical protein